MKEFMFGLASLLVLLTGLIYTQDYDRNERFNFGLKFTTEEVAAAAAQFYDTEKFSEGIKVFNQEEGMKAARFIMKDLLHLNNDFTPTARTYWKGPIRLELEFFDDETIYDKCSSGYPCMYEHETSAFTFLITNPTVIATIHTGPAIYRLMDDPPENFRVSVHEWEERYY